MTVPQGGPLGLLGGTFDPVHRAHLALARAAMSGLGLAGVRWIPSGQPGHRGRPGAAVQDRLSMLELALRGESRFELDRADALAPRPTYTVDTLARLRGELGAKRPLAFIIGADQLLALDTWREWQSLFAATHFAVAERPGYRLDKARLPPAVARELATRSAVSIGAEAAGKIVRFAMPPMAVSATAIREGAARGCPPEDMLPAAVLDYIRTHHLYRNPAI